MYRISIIVLGFLSFMPFASLAAQRDDVLVIVNGNSIDSPQVGAYYAQLREINPANIVQVLVPNQAFISQEEFNSLRDQILRFGICPTVPAASRPAACSDAGLPMYTEVNINALTANTPIRYIVTTRGVPSRFQIPNPPNSDQNTSVDNYLKFWLAQYFAQDVNFSTAARMEAFGDGRGMRIVNPAIDGEYIIGRIDGVNLESAKALVDRAIAAEQDGIYGKLYGNDLLLNNYRGVSLWQNVFSLFNETRPECSDYQSPTHYWNFVETDDPQGKTPQHCLVKYNKASPNETVPGYPSSRQPLADDALAHFGELDGQTITGGFDTLLNWRKNTSCQNTLCSTAADPAACRAASSDPFQELDTNCIGVAPGFFGYTHVSYPLAYYGIWPTGWESALSGEGKNDVPKVDTSQGAGDSASLWFRQPDAVTNPSCYVYSNGILGSTTQDCLSEGYIGLTQNIDTSPLDPNSPPSYTLSFSLKGESLVSQTTVASTVRFDYPIPPNGAPCPTGLNAVIDPLGVLQGCRQEYGAYDTVAVADNTWNSSGRTVQPPANTGLGYTSIKVIFSGNLDAGGIGFDAVSLTEQPSNSELVSNGSFVDGHRQTVTGDFAANFLDRLGGTAFYGSVSHHNNASGHSFRESNFDRLTYIMRGLPLGDSVWWGDNKNSGMLYGDPLYTPLVIKLNYFNDPDDRFAGIASITGSAINGLDTNNVNTTYQIDYCPGHDYYLCDLQQTWQNVQPAQSGGPGNPVSASWDASALPYGEYTLRLAVESANSALGKTQTFNDFYRVRHRYVEDEIPTYSLSGTIAFANGQPMPGVGITIYSGSTTYNTVTDAAGRYKYSGLSNGWYFVMPSQSNYNFTPTSISQFQKIEDGNVTDIDFAATGTDYSISGLIHYANGQPMAGTHVDIFAPGGVLISTSTNINGYYSLAGFQNGTHVTSPSRSGYSFDGNVVVYIQNQNPPDKTFTALGSSGSISGIVKDGDNNPLPGIKMDLNSSVSDTTPTNANGYYQFLGQQNNFYLVTPLGTEYSFSPINASGVFAGADVIADFTATPLGHSISGFILENSQPLADVDVLIYGTSSSDPNFFTSVTTTGSGFYSVSVPRDGTYVILPIKSGYFFTAVDGAYTEIMNSADIIDEDYIAIQQ